MYIPNDRSITLSYFRTTKKKLLKRLTTSTPTNAAAENDAVSLKNERTKNTEHCHDRHQYDKFESCKNIVNITNFKVRLDDKL